MLSPNEKRNLRNMFQSPAWLVVGKVLQEYKKTNFYETSAKRDTEFETMWGVAHIEGGKDHLKGFINQLTQEADDR